MPYISDSNSYTSTGLEKLQESGKYADLTIRSNNRDYYAHKAIVCSRSDFFDGACSSSFLEAQTGIIDLSEDDENTVEHMINYFYRLDYTLQERSSPRRNSSPCRQTSSSPPRPLRRPRRRSVKVRSLIFEDPLLAQAVATSPVTDASITASGDDSIDQEHESKPKLMDEDTETYDEFADAYSDEFEEHPELGYNITEPIERPSQDELVSHAMVYAIAEKYGIPGLKVLARKKFLANLYTHIPYTSFSSALAEVYTSTIDSDRGLREPMLQLFRQNPQLVFRSDIREVMEDIDDIHMEIERAINGMPTR
ncbi:hypothetical protein EJ05DRAFT_347563 [Pseudovirgaria hyperparasitica]|uniref:BTB domain-containing protein n=1 Tax=Pseudovirgaria hyperparasitica TaxID=470096 RepID=A0A6A6W628_9PEZI|nr:uncharacterized protein EJ05DRAFT_347563 [Pseudovirgaria hyperparasitica]KAF2758332.1 hypothetical protein EJ05DRAFT_347563 [Pseudovirgaria hyperparasitica]